MTTDFWRLFRSLCTVLATTATLVLPGLALGQTGANDPGNVMARTPKVLKPQSGDGSFNVASRRDSQANVHVEGTVVLANMGGKSFEASLDCPFQMYPDGRMYKSFTMASLRFVDRKERILRIYENALGNSLAISFGESDGEEAQHRKTGAPRTGDLYVVPLKSNRIVASDVEIGTTDPKDNILNSPRDMLTFGKATRKQTKLVANQVAGGASIACDLCEELLRKATPAPVAFEANEKEYSTRQNAAKELVRRAGGQLVK